MTAKKAKDGDDKDDSRPIADNRKAFHDFHILETFEAGIALLGTEVKGIREGQANLRDSYARVEKGEVWLFNVHINPYSHRGYVDHDPKRKRRLLLHKYEIRKLIGKTVEKGLTLYANASVRRLESSGRKITAVHAEILDPATQRPTGKKLKVTAKVTAVCGGALNSPAILLRSGLDGGGKVGKRTWLHPVVLMMALFEEKVEAFSGAPQSVYSHHFIDRGPGKIGYFLEVPPVHPMLGATVGTGIGAPLMDLMKQLPHLQVCLAITVDGLLPEEQGGTVKLKDGAYSRLSFNYDLGPANWEAFRDSCKEMAKVQFAAGAKKVMSLHYDPVVMDSPNDIDKLDAATWEKIKLRVVTAHQMGGCPMGKDPSTSVVDSTLKFHGMDNLFVVDGSVFPTSLGVNPQESIMGISRWAAQHVAAAV